MRAAGPGRRALLTGGAGQTLAQKKSAIGSFAALTAVEADQAQADAKTWLKSVGKDDAATLQKFDAVLEADQSQRAGQVAETFKLGSPPRPSCWPSRQPAIPGPDRGEPLFHRQEGLGVLQVEPGPGLCPPAHAAPGVEQALDVLNTTRPNRLPIRAVTVHKAVCQHGLLQQEDAKTPSTACWPT